MSHSPNVKTRFQLKNLKSTKCTLFLYTIVIFLFFYYFINLHRNTSTYCKFPPDNYSSIEEENSLIYSSAICPFKNRACKLAMTSLKFKWMDVQFIVRKHNEIRQLFALGHFISPRNFSLFGSNVNVLSWHKKLENIAQCVTITCSPCLNSKAFPNVSIRSAIMDVFEHNTSDSNLIGFNFIQKVVNKWSAQSKNLQMNVLESYRSYTKFGPIWNFASVVWPTSKYIGCAATRFWANVTYFVCVYDQSRQNGEALLNFGYPASDCPLEMSGNLSYTGLCGEVEYVID